MNGVIPVYVNIRFYLLEVRYSTSTSKTLFDENIFWLYHSPFAYVNGWPAF